VPVGACAGDAERDAVAIDAGRAFQAAFAAVDRRPASPVPAARGFRDRAVGTDVGHVQADHPVVGVEGQLMQSFAEPGVGPRPQPAADRPVRTAIRDDAFVTRTVDKSGDDVLEHDLVTDPPTVTTEGMGRSNPGFSGRSAANWAQRGSNNEDGSAGTGLHRLQSVENSDDR
jgi:hypothetical protein